MIEWISRNKRSVIRAAFLIPILSVAAISISHVVSWYDLANPISWAIYLSIAIEVAAMSAIAASSVKVKGFSVWFVFIIVTLIQFIGNIFFSYSEIDETTKSFQDWSELTGPVFESFGADVNDVISQKRWLALLEGGLLPLISLTCLHFFIKYGEQEESTLAESEKETLDPVEEPNIDEKPADPSPNEIEDEQAVLANSQYRQEETVPEPVIQPKSPAKKSTRIKPGVSSKIQRIQGK
jgi:hypothetical protein